LQNRQRRRALNPRPSPHPLDPPPTTHPHTQPNQPAQKLSPDILRPVICLLSQPLITLAPDPAIDWPPPGGLPVRGDSYLILHGRHSHGAVSDDDGEHENEHVYNPEIGRRLLAPAPVEVAAAALAAHDQQSIGKEKHHFANVNLALGYAPALFNVERNVQKEGGMVEVQSMRLVQLAQGPTARAAASLQDPAVWTLMLWSFHRWVGGGCGCRGCCGWVGVFAASERDCRGSPCASTLSIDDARPAPTRPPACPVANTGPPPSPSTSATWSWCCRRRSTLR